MPIYTKTGDSGETSLFGGKRVSKSHAKVDVYGSVDELNCWIGLVIAESTEKKEEHIRSLLLQMQRDLFVIGGYLASWQADLSPLSTRVIEMELEIDALDEQLPKLTQFILPGGCVRAAHVHIVRSIVRRVERLVVELAKHDQIDTRVIQYMNRLSDLFFMLARYITKNDNGQEIYWSTKEEKT